MSDKVTDEIKLEVCSNMLCLRVYDSHVNLGRLCPQCGSPLIDAPEWDDDDE